MNMLYITAVDPDDKLVIKLITNFRLLNDTFQMSIVTDPYDIMGS